MSINCSEFFEANPYISFIVVSTYGFLLPIPLILLGWIRDLEVETRIVVLQLQLVQAYSDRKFEI
jgi:hypothetical protein